MPMYEITAVATKVFFVEAADDDAALESDEAQSEFSTSGMYVDWEPLEMNVKGVPAKDIKNIREREPELILTDR